MKRTVYIGALVLILLSACGGSVDSQAMSPGRDQVIEVFKPPL